MKLRRPTPRVRPRMPARHRMGRLAGGMGRSLALSAALAAAACATLPKSTLPRAPKPRPPTAADYEPARRAAREMRSVRHDPARMQAIEAEAQANTREAWNRMNQELFEEQKKALAENRLLVNDIAMKLGGYPAVLRSALIESFRGHHKLFMDANNVAGEILNAAGYRGRVARMLETGRAIAVYDTAARAFTLDVDAGTDRETVARIENALKPLAKAMLEVDARTNQRVDGFVRGLVDQEVELVDKKAELERANQELRKKLDGPK